MKSKKIKKLKKIEKKLQEEINYLNRLIKRDEMGGIKEEGELRRLSEILSHGKILAYIEVLAIIWEDNDS